MEDYKKMLQTILSPKRYSHSVAVAAQARWLAQQWGANPDKAEEAGLLHDICKEWPHAKQLQYAKQHGILLHNYKKGQEELTHGLVGRLYLQHELHIWDEEILLAVEHHVIGRPAMTPIEEVVFVADYTSEDREYSHCVKVRNMLPASRTEAIFSIMRHTTARIIHKRIPLAMRAVASYNYYAELLKSK